MTCRILLDCPQKVNAGSKIYGRIQCKFCVHENVEEIRCVLKGLESIGNHNSHAKEFLHKKQILVPRGIVKAGRYDYPFCIELPQDIPSSFQVYPATIHYFLRAVIDIPSNPQEDFVLIYVNSYVDLNKLQRLLQLKPFSIEDNNKVGCCCWAGSPIQMTVTLEKNAFILGEKINVKIDIKNSSEHKIDVILLSLRRELQWRNNEHDKKPHTKLKEIIADESLPSVDANEEATLFASILIPQYTQLHNFVLCTLTDELFSLLVDAVQAANHVTIETKLILGHIPLITGGNGKGVSVSQSRSRHNKSKENIASRHKISRTSIKQDHVTFGSVPEGSYGMSQMGMPSQGFVSSVPQNFIPTSHPLPPIMEPSSMFDQPFQQ